MIQKIAVLGAGTMGHGIAETFAMNGYDVNLYDTDEDKLRDAKKEIGEELKLLVEENFIEPQLVAMTLDRITLFTDLKQTVKDRDYVIEAVPENLELKQKLFTQLDEHCPPHTILSSNTSSLNLTNMMEFVSNKRKEQMIVTHWYNPGHLMPLVELSYFGNMPDYLFKEVEQLYHSIKKQTIKVLKDIPGLIANRIQQGIAREVFSLIEMGAATPDDIDKALKFGPAFRYATTGHLEITDLGGLDIWCTVGDNLLKVMDNSQHANEMLRQKVTEGKLGMKSGEGFYEYKKEDVSAIKERFAKKLIHQLKASDYYIDKSSMKI
ncbi:3-hydroxyacyl-CoA dehydrogenase family protein [Priestia aryabhattai]|uniref:3-hydroxyacyl-CoA dehydrogenase family protein n=1 Tax=Priestia aryabhattai TaxID=412384 RepID=UPI001C0BCA92|nr:3-hydroxyacyl-CoA dehydrogenase family protein [Priestia aryabhattai]MBU3569929.1 3-hydroxyacyl-CoA dehydrogenase family protein [Priestia aryabhattai]WDL87727.1 3-hydroxyacyl-CoA dehydrogenase family protein [Priestia aryabhattai]